MSDFSDLQKKINYKFKNEEYLKTALTHPSYSGENNYERFEFLGDAVLELCVSEMLFSRFADKDEGFLTKKRASLVCRESLCALALLLGMDKLILLGKGEEENGGRKKHSILENVFESVMGAVFFDSDYITAKKVIENIFGKKINSEVEDKENYKSKLQEFLQQNGSRKIEYFIEEVKGPPHNAVFYAGLKLEGRVISHGRGKSKKEAEQDAAKGAYNKFFNSNDNYGGYLDD